jgi:GT2 family glycosyltransferase
VTLPRVGIVLVNWNGLDDTLECLVSLRKQDYPAWTAYVVDNGSKTPEGPAIAAAFPEARVIESKANLGFAGGNNLGVQRALDDGCDYVFLLNNDTLVPQPDALAQLVRLAQGEPDAVVGCKIAYASDPEVVWFAGGSLDLAHARAEHVGVGEPASRFTGIRATDFVTGCALLAPADLVRRAGPWDDAYFLYFEDVDWNLRAKREGARFLLDLDVVVLHKVSRSVKKSGPVDFYYLLRNRLYFGRRWSGARYWTTILPRGLWDAAYLYAHDLKHGDKARRRYVRRAVADWLRGRRGRMR